MAQAALEIEPTDDPQQPAPWKHPRRAVGVAAVMTAIVVARGVRTYLAPEGDFTLHWIFGRRFVAGGFLYAAGMHSPYPPFWAMAASLFSWGPMREMHILLYPLGLVPLGLMVASLTRRLTRRWPLDRERAFWAIVLGLGLSSRFLIRELPECGANLLIVALAWGGLFAWTRGRDSLGGVSLGLAIALKCTPVMFLAYFAWKRQWRIVGSTVVAALGFTLAPLIWMGSAAYTRHVEFWIANVQHGLAHTSPLQGVLGDEEPWNLGLKTALGRWLVAVPSTHKGYVDHPWAVRPIGLRPDVAGLLVKAAMLALLALLARAIRRQPPRRDGLAVLWEGAAVSLVMLLYSPITWRQHCVGALPALSLIAWRWVAGESPRGWPRMALGFYALAVIGLDRGIVGRDWTLVLDSYGLTAWALLALLAVVIDARARASSEEARDRDHEALIPHPSVPAPHLSEWARGRVRRVRGG